MAATKTYRDHLHDQYVDRSVAWSLQELSCDISSGTLCICLDGMDQGKFAIPSDASLRASAVRAKHVRPTLKLHGAWCFGWVLDLWVLDEPTKHDSSCVIEIVALCLERVYEKTLELGQPMPGTLLLFSDNTVREAKNSYVLGYLNNLISKYKMRLTGLLCLRKSHSHDRIDQLWGLLARRISCCDQLLSPDSVVEIVKHELNRKGLKSWIGLNTEIRVNKINAVRCWRHHFTPQKVVLSGGLQEDSTANHCFLCIARRGRTPQKKIICFTQQTYLGDRISPSPWGYPPSCLLRFAGPPRRKHQCWSQQSCSLWQ